MAGSRGTCLYKEARLNIEPAFPGSTIHITLPVQDNSTFGNRPQPKRTVLSEQHSDRDEDAFTRRHLASDGSMYFRKHHQYPRSFLWRLLDNRKLLEIQSTDLDHDEAHKVEANVTILLRFASPVRPFCIAFADPEERDALTVFAITSANEFYTITLHRDFFTKPSASEQEVSDWCRLSLPTQLQIRIPYRLVAQSSSELLVTLDNGGILWLTKTNKDDITWNEAVFLETSWSGSMRGLLTWTREQKVRFDNGDLDVSAAAAVAKSPDGKHLLSVCLNHKLRAWNLQTGRPGVQVDLLGEPDRPNDEGASYIVGPAQPNLMAVVDIQGGVDGTVYYVVTYSPKQHQFKFWGIRDADEVEQGIYDVKPDFEFIPPVDELMDTTAWTLAEFFINPGPGPSRWRGAELWIRARSGPSSKVYSLRFNLKDEPSKLASTWKNGWLSVDSGPLSVEQLRKNPTNPGEQDLELSELYQGDVTERWLDFLFYPGRFTTATLEAALLVFQRGLERAKTPRSVSTGSLKERISATVGTFAVLGQNGVTSQDGYQDTLAAQWQAFYSLVKDLHKRRGEHLSLAFDYESNMPWLVLSDYLSAIRLCSDAETVALNSSALASPRGLSGPLRKSIADPQDRNVARLLNAAASFRKSLPRPFQSRLQDELANELLQSRSLSVVDRMELLEANCNLSQLVTDDDLSALVEELGSDVRELTTKTFMRAITLLKQQEQGAVVEPKRQVARFGLNALVRVSQEILDLNKNVLLDLLVLILFMQYEEELSDEFDASAVFVEIICELKDNAVLSWLASMVWSNPAPTGPSSITLLSSLTATSKNRKPASFNQTVLEGVLGYKAFEVPMPKGLQTELLTYWSRVWLALAFKEDYAVSLETIMGILLSQGEYELAFKFSKFLPVTTWATYLRGRMYLALGDNALASICFQKPAYKLGLGPFNIEHEDKISLISVEEHDSFANGLPSYYHHVLGLFEKYRAYPYVADFARLGLRCLRGRENEKLRTELLSRLFNASIQTSRFDDAYSAMIRHTNTALRSAALQTLVTTMITQRLTPHLLSFPFLDLTQEVDALLLAQCHKQLNLASGPPYHQILYAFRITRNNFRGAASILYDRLQRLKSSSSQIHDPADETIANCYLMIINTLESVGKDDAYILAESRIDNVAPTGLGGASSSALGSGSGSAASNAPPQWGIGKAKKLLKRKVVTLDVLRKEYQAELDRVEAIETGQYPFVEAGDEMDIL